MTHKHIHQREALSGSNHRMLRIGDQIQKIVSQFVLCKARDPRFKSISITSVHVSPDMRHADILVLPHSEIDPARYSDILTALNKASGFFRKELAHQLNLRVTPHLHFVQDNAMLQVDRLMQLIQKAPISESDEQTTY